MVDEKPDTKPEDKAPEKEQSEPKATLWEQIKQTRPHPPYRPGEKTSGWERE